MVTIPAFVVAETLAIVANRFAQVVLGMAVWAFNPMIVFCVRFTHLRLLPRAQDCLGGRFDSLQFGNAQNISNRLTIGQIAGLVLV
jgi:hypothetical protein